MKIALYSGTFVKDKDGVARTLYEFVNCIKDQGHEVKVWSPDVPKKADNNTNVEIKRMISLPMILYPDYKVGFFSARTKMELDRFQPDIIHISTPDLVGREFLLYGKRNNIPLITVYHTDFPSYLSYFKLGAFTRAIWTYLEWFYNLSDLTLVPTETMKRKLTKKGIKNLHVWSRGISSAQFSPDLRNQQIRKDWGVDNKFVILYSGRFVWYKDLADFILIYEILMKKRKDIAFVLLGSGPIEDDLKKAMPEAVFPGYLTGNKLGIAYASADLLVFPSTTETFGNVVQEALASGIPAVVSDKGGCKDIIQLSKGGLISKSNDIDSFVSNIEKIIDNEDIYRTLKENGIKLGKERSWEKINQDILKEYENIVHGG